MSKCALAIDYGGKRTGLAICDAMGIAAQPLAAIVSRDVIEVATKSIATAREYGAKVLVVGMPFMPDGSEGQQAAKTRLFLAELKKQMRDDERIVEIDERHTSKEAHTLLREGGMKSAKKRKQLVDSTAAVVILREWLVTGDRR